MKKLLLILLIASVPSWAQFSNASKFWNLPIQQPSAAADGKIYALDWSNKRFTLIAASGTGTVTSVVIAGTANQITVAGTCTITAAGTCTISLPSSITGVTTISSLVSVGTITTGVWSGTAIAIAKGGTGATTQQAAFDALAPTATRAGDITYWNGTHYVNLAGNNSGTKILQEDSSGVPSWVTNSGGTGTPCTTTALSLQYNAAGSFGCISSFTSNGTTTITGDSNAVLDLSVASSVALPAVHMVTTTAFTMTAGARGTFVPSATLSGLTINGVALTSYVVHGGDLLMDVSGQFFTSNGTNVNAHPFVAGSGATPPSAPSSGKCVEWGGNFALTAAAAACSSGSGDVVGPGSATDNAVVRFDGTTGKLVQNSAVTIADTTGNIVTPGSITTGSGGSAAGYLELGQGSAPSNGTTAVQISAPASVTSYQFILPGASATGFLLGTDSSNTNTVTFVGFTGTSNVVRATSPTFTNAILAGTDNSTAGTLQLANSAANAHTIWGSGATTSNTIQGFATVPTTGHLIDCTVSSTTCLMHDSGVVTANVVNATSPGAGIAHFAGSTQTVTSSLIVAADITSATITGTQIASSIALAGSPTTTTQAQNDNSTKIATTAYVDRPVLLPAAGTSVSLAAPREYYVCSSTCTVTPPVPAAGYEFCVRNADNSATVITLAALGSSARYETTARTSYGTAGTGTFVSGGAATDQVCIVGLDSTHYLTMSFTGTWTAN